MKIPRHLVSLVEPEKFQESKRLTAIEPWPEAEVETAYLRIGVEWDAIEEKGTQAQGHPAFQD